MYNLIKIILFRLHLISILFVSTGWYFEPKILLFYPIVISSWYINDNKCIISQIEYFLFNETFIGKGPKYYVPKIHRYLFCINFIIGIFYNMYKCKYI